MGGEECDVVGDRLFNPFFFDGQVRKIAVLEFRALPGDRGKVGRWREQLLRNRLAPFFDQCVPLAIISRGERSTVADPAFLGERECAAPLDARRPVVRNTAGIPPRVATRDPDPSSATRSQHGSAMPSPSTTRAGYALPK
jgi:hypothetical protein